jgi:hypothetical protein
MYIGFASTSWMGLDAFIFSCFVHLRRPDADIFGPALDTAHGPARLVAYVENTSVFVEVSKSLVIRSILHTDYKSTCARLASFGLRHRDGVLHEAS